MTAPSGVTWVSEAANPAGAQLGDGVLEVLASSMRLAGLTSADEPALEVGAAERRLAQPAPL